MGILSISESFAQRRKGFYRKKYNKQDRHRTFNVTLRRVRVTIFAVEKHQVLNVTNACLLSYLSYPACKSHLSGAVLYCHVWLI
jgi:hypothetical protein